LVAFAAGADPGELLGAYALILALSLKNGGVDRQIDG